MSQETTSLYPSFHPTLGMFWSDLFGRCVTFNKTIFEKMIFFSIFLNQCGHINLAGAKFSRIWRCFRFLMINLIRWNLINNCFLIFLDKNCKKWMGHAYRAGQELSENGRNINFLWIFDQFMSEILFDFHWKNRWKTWILMEKFLSANVWFGLQAGHLLGC